MDWVDMVERERGREEEMQERIHNIVVCTCDICGEELHHGEEAYKISDEDICICEYCYDKECGKQRPETTKCKLCGNPYIKRGKYGATFYDMVKVYDEHYCEDCFDKVELCANEDEINSIKYHINYDEE